MAELYIFNQNDELLTIITEDTGLVSAPVRIELNSVSDTPFSFTVEADSKVAEHVKEENKVVYRDHEGDLRLVVIRELDDSDSMEGPLTTSICEPEFLELREHFIIDRRFTDRTAQFMLDAALEGSRYTGEVDVELGTGSTNFYYIDAVEAIWKIIDVMGGEFKDVVEFDEQNNIIARKIKLLQRLGADTGQRLEIDHNITEIGRTVLSYPKTAMIGRGASLEIEDEEGEHTGGYTRYIGIGDVEWSVANGDPVDKPLGQLWVGDPEALEVYGLEHEGGKLHRFGIFHNQDYEDPEDLIWATWQHLQENKRPSVNYRLSVELFDDKVSLGDTAIAIDRYFSRPIEIQSRIIAMEYDLLDIDGTMVVEMGQFLDLDDDRLNELERDVEQLRNHRPTARVSENSYPNTKPSTPQNVSATGAFETIQLHWDYADELFIKHYEVYGSQVADFVPDSQHLLWRGQVSAFAHIVDTDETWYYYVRAVNYHGMPSDWSERVSASTVRIISRDILFGEDMAEELRELNRISDIIGENGVDLSHLHDEVPEYLKRQAIEYTDEEIRLVRENLEGQLNDRIGNVNDSISGLEEMAGGLKHLTEDLEGRLNDQVDTLEQFEFDIDELERKVTLNIEEIERLEGGIEANALEIETSVEGINLAISDFRSEYADDKTDILSSIEQNRLDIEATSEGLELMVSKEEYQLDMEGVDERIASTETGLEIVAGQISAKAEKSELLNFVDKSTYNRQVGELTTSIDGITGKVQNVETELNKATGEISSALSQIGELKITTGSITQSVTELRGDFDSEISSLSGSIETLAGEVKLKASQKSVNDLTGELTSLQGEIKLFPDRINLAVSEGISSVTGDNLIPDGSFENDGLGWNTNNSRVSVVTNESHSGTNSLRFTAGSNTASASLLKNIPVVPGEIYEVSGWYKTTSNANGTSSNQKLRIGDQNGSISTISAGFGFDGAATSWTNKTRRVTIPNGVTALRVSIVANHTVGTVYWDDISIRNITNQVDKTNVLSSINLSTEGIRLRGDLIHLDGTSLIDRGIIQTAHIADAAIERAHLQRSIIGEAQIDDLAVTDAKIRSVSADKISATTLSAITADMGTVRSGRLLSNNNNMDLNLNTGNLTMQNANFTFGGGARIDFTNSSNRITYRFASGITRSAGLGVGLALGGQYPFSYLGTTGASELDTLSQWFSGFIANTTARISEGGANSINGMRVQLRDTAVDWNKSVTVDFTGSTTDVNFAGARTNFNVVGDFHINNISTSAGWLIQTAYSGTDLVFRGINGNSHNYQIGTSRSIDRIRNIFLTNNPDVSSDERLKTEIEDLGLGLDFIKQIEAKKFRLKLTNADTNQGMTQNPIQYGIIAQQVNSVLADFGVTENTLITESEDGLYGARYEQFIPPLINSVQELDDKVVSITSALEKRIDKRINDLELENQMLREKIRQQDERITYLEELIA